MHITEAIEYINNNLPDIEEKVLEEAKDNNERIDLQDRFNRLRECIVGKNPMTIGRNLRFISNRYIDKLKIDKDVFDKICRINELSGLLTKAVKEPIIFLSHSSKDWKYANPLRNFISELGVADNQIIYTSHFKHKIPVGENIYKYLAKRIHENCLMINLWSENYFKSLACICETGAAWVSGCEYVKLCVPPLSFNDQRFGETPIDIKRAGIILDGSDMCKTGMAELGHTIKRFFRFCGDQDIERPLNSFMADIIKAEKERLYEEGQDENVNE